MAKEHNSQNIVRNDALTPTAFSEKLASLCVVHYNDRTLYYQKAKELFQTHPLSWTVKDNAKAVTEVFRHAKLAYMRQMLMEFGVRYFQFVDGLDLIDEEMFSSFEFVYMTLTSIQGDNFGFLMAGLKNPQTMEVANLELKNVFLSKDRTEVTEALLKADKEVIGNLSQNNLNSLIRPMYFNKEYDVFAQTLFELQYYSTILSLANNKPTLILDEYVPVMEKYFLEHSDKASQKSLYHILMRKRKAFQSIYDFLKLLNEEEKEQYYREMYNYAFQYRCENGFDFVYDYPTGASPKRLKQFNVIEFTVLHDEIVKLFPEDYLPALISVFERKNKAYQQWPEYCYFDCLERYDSDFADIINLPIFKTLSLKDEKLRYRYLKILKQHHAFSLAGIQEYRG